MLDPILFRTAYAALPPVALLGAGGLTIVALTVALRLALRASRGLAIALRESESKFRTVIETMQEGVIVRDRAGALVVANSPGREILDLTLDQLAGRSPFESGWQAIHEDGQPWPREEWPSYVALREGKAQRDRIMGVRTAFGETIWLSISAMPLFREGEDRPYLVVTPFSDITVRKRREDRTRRQIGRAEDANAALTQANARLTDIALTDGLTGLRNHRAFKERLASEVARSRNEGHPLSLILLDVDEFKAYNDRFGHPEGDEALKEVARALASVARSSDLVARHGGEEFAILLPETDERGARALAERLRAAVQQTPWPKRPVTASFGVATLREGDDAERLVADADEALYRAKRAGRNRVDHADDRDGERFLVA